MDKMKFRQLAILLFPIMLICIFFACEKRGEGPRLKKIKVVTTLFPLYDMAGGIGGDKADVSLLLPPGVEAHSFEPRPSDIIKINEADIFVYTGKFMEPWAGDIVKGAISKNLIVVDTSLGAKMIPAVSNKPGVPPGSPDPHIWLDFDNAKVMVKNILQAFLLRDAADKHFYEQRANNYIDKLIEMDALYKTTLATCNKREFVYGGHYAFGYLARRYGLTYLAAQGISPDAEPTASDLIRLVEQIREKKIGYIFYEELASPKIAGTIAGETGARMLMLNAAPNLSRDQLDRGISLFDILKRDLDNLRIGLECK
jgi:zinc transport system substrate-binding protein